MQEQQSSNSGFSLVELLIAIVILAVGLLGLAELQITATKANSQSETILAASSLAQQVIEEVSAKASNDGMFSDADGTYAWDPATVSVAGGGTYNIEYTLETGYQGVTNLCLITVRVTSAQALLNVGGNKIRTVTATTLKRAT